MNLELNGHVAVVTGGASGIGAACARGLEAEGCRVAIWDLSNGVDVADYDAVQAALADTEARLGPVRHVVHAAAMGSGRFGFPFIFAVKGKTKDDIIQSFESRINNSKEEEFSEALRQIERIALLRLKDRLPA